MTDDTSITLTWRLSDITENYPELSLEQAELVLNRLDRNKGWLMQEGWHLIADIISDIREDNS